jgi:hypothetical protein
MLRPSRFLCPSCGKQLPGDALDPTRTPACNDCGRLAQWWETPDPVPARLPPPLPASVPVISASSSSAAQKWPVVPICVAVGVLVVVATALWRVETLHSEAERKAAVEVANRVVAAKVETARARMTGRDFEGALQSLDDALATPDATRLDDARLMLLQARQGKANALLEGAAAAVARRNVAKARQLLQEYLVHPYADQRTKATLLLDELGRASADEDAIRLLATLTDEKLSAVAETGLLPEGEHLTDEGMRDLYRDTLRRHVPREQQARAARRDAAIAMDKKREREQVEREERLRVSARFLEVKAFAESVRKLTSTQRAQRQEQDRALEQFLNQTGVNNPAARENARQAIRAGRDGENAVLLVARRKAQAKKDYRQAKEYDPADEETFDSLVDQELDRLLAELKKLDPPGPVASPTAGD